MSITLHAELEQLTKLGEVSDPKTVPPIDPFSGSPDPFRLDPTDFSTGVEVANALLTATPQDGSELMNFSKAELTHTDAEQPCENSIGCPSCNEATADDYPEAK